MFKDYQSPEYHAFRDYVVYHLNEEKPELACNKGTLDAIIGDLFTYITEYKKANKPE